MLMNMLSFENWPKEALLCVASKYLERADIREEEKHQTSIVCEFFHSSACLLSIRLAPYSSLMKFEKFSSVSIIIIINIISSIQIPGRDGASYLHHTYFLSRSHQPVGLSPHTKAGLCHKSQTEILLWT